MVQQSALEYLAHGQTPFFRLPSAAGRLPPSGTRATFLGVPFDGGSTYQPGARFGPFHVRRVSALLQGWHPEHGLEVFERAPAVDGGNVVFPPFQAAAMRERVEEEVTRILEVGVVPFLVGGDHSIALPALRAAARVHGPVAVVHVDAHFDTSGPEVWGERFHHGTPFRHALDEALVLPGQLHQVGVRGPRGSCDDDAGPPGRYDGSVYSAFDVAELGVRSVANDIRRVVGDRPVYLSFDVDAVDPAFAPGTGTPVPGGLTSREALALLRALGGVRLVGMDVVEVCPALDHSDLTSLLAAHVLFEGLALVAVRAAGWPATRPCPAAAVAER